MPRRPGDHVLAVEAGPGLLTAVGTVTNERGEAGQLVGLLAAVRPRSGTASPDLRGGVGQRKPEGDQDQRAQDTGAAKSGPAMGDHRLAMMLAVAGLIAEGETLIDGFECVSKSFPDFEWVLYALMQ